jgi:hypothetical protein
MLGVYFHQQTFDSLAQLSQEKRSSGVYLVLNKHFLNGHCYVILPPQAYNPIYFASANVLSGLHDSQKHNVDTEMEEE